MVDAVVVVVLYGKEDSAITVRFHPMAFRVSFVNLETR